MHDLDRRRFLSAAGAAGAAAALSAIAPHARAQPDRATPDDARPDRPQPDRDDGDSNRGPAVIASANGLRTVALAHDRITNGTDPTLAVVEGVGLVEADPDDVTVGYGGLPNERGVVQLDASVMHGPTHRAGAVAAIENIAHPAKVALRVLQSTDHCLLVGAGALEFAKAHGFPEEDLLTEKARRLWMQWKRRSSPADDWLNDDQLDWPAESITEPGPGRLDGDEHSRGLESLLPADAVAAGLTPAEFFDAPPPGWPAGVPFTRGTIHCSGVTADGDVGSCTTTSGLSFKIPGRVGDSPIVGAGMYCDNAVGGAGATGFGEAVIQSCGAFDAVREMDNGASPTDACLNVLKRIVDRSRRQRRLFENNTPAFNVRMYAVRRDGAFGSASIRAGRDGSPFAVCTAAGARIERGPALYQP
jgi:N4-(beta-N-acetylglucosaminyl)-L-asparaginase